jgi:hypothetical protein
MLAQGLLQAALKLAGSDSDDSDEEEEQPPLRNWTQGGQSRPSISPQVVLRVFKQSRSQTLHKIIVE